MVWYGMLCPYPGNPNIDSSFCMHFLVFLFCVLDANFLNLHPFMWLIRPMDVRGNKYAYTPSGNKCSVDIWSLLHASGDTKSTYLDHIVEVCVWVLYSKFGQCFYIEIVPYFIFANLLYLIFVLIGRFGVLSWSSASPVRDANHKG